MKVLKMLQQGDVNIVQIDAVPDLPDWFKPAEIESGVIREGTATGHSHRIVGTEFRLFRHGRRMFAEIKSEDCKMVHEEHETIDLPVGKYEFVATVEYDHFADRSRYVLD